MLHSNIISAGVVSFLVFLIADKFCALFVEACLITHVILYTPDVYEHLWLLYVIKK